MSFVNVSTKGMDEALQKLKAYPAKMKAAQRIIIQKTTVYAAQQALQSMATAHRIPVQVLVKHRRVQTRFGIVWVGFNPLPAGEAGNPVKTSDGVYVNGIHYSGAFIIRQPDGSLSVYSRGPGSPRYGLRSSATQKRPLEEVMYPLDQTEIVMQRVAGLAVVYMGNIAMDAIRSVQ